jgi:uncharacterized protein (DUF1697 family)
VDLLVVHDGEQANRTVRRQLERLFLNRRFGLDLLVRTPEDVARNLADRNPFYTCHIFEEGTTLYERFRIRYHRCAGPSCWQIRSKR